MKIATLFLVLSLALVINPVCAAPIPLKTVAGLGAAAGSILSTGLMGIVDTIKNDKLAQAQARTVQLENELNYHKTQKLMENGSFKEGFWVGAMLTVLVGCFIAVMVSNVEPNSGNVAIKTNVLNADKEELTAKA